MLQNDSIFTFFRYLLKKWWVLSIVGFIGGCTGIIYAFSQPTIYKSNLVFVLDEGGNGGGSSGISSLASQFGLNLGSPNDIFSGDNIITIVKSRRIIEQTLLAVDTFNGERQTLVNFYLQHVSHSIKAPQNISFLPDKIRSTYSKAEDSILYKIYKRFETSYIDIWKPDKYLSIYQVTVVSEDEVFSKVFTEKLIDQTNTFYTQMRTKKARETMNILEQRVAAMKGNLNASISEKASSQDANLNPAFSAAQIPAIRSQLDAQAYGQAYGEMFKNLELARYQYLKEIPLMQIIDPAAYPMQKIKQGKIKTGLIFSLAAVFLTVFFLWGYRIFNLLKNSNSDE